LVAEWLANGRRLIRPEPGDHVGSDLTINEMLVGFLRWAEGYYRKNGHPTREADNIKDAIRPLRRLYGHTKARDFAPTRLKTVRAAMIESGLCRSVINKRVSRIVMAFRWAVENELVPPAVYQGLRAVRGLPRGRSEARESEPVRPVPDAFVDAIRPHVARQVWALVELQRLTGMRPGEACIMRTIDIDMSCKVWSFRPETHKSEHHGRQRTIFLGPQAQAILRHWLRPDLSAFLFSPAEAMAERSGRLRESRRTPIQPSQRNRRKPHPAKVPSDHYTVDSYRRAIAYGCRKADVPKWHPNQLRHNAATRLRKEFGLDVARAVLGHSSPVVTEVYAELDMAKAAEAIAKVG
jgi:integrase